MVKLTPVQKIRQQNFHALVKMYRNQTIASDELGIATSQISLYKNGNKGMGEQVAERIEKRAALKKGSMSVRDAHHTFPDPSSGMLDGVTIRPDLMQAIPHKTNLDDDLGVGPDNSGISDSSHYACIQSVEYWQGIIDHDVRIIRMPYSWLHEAGATEKSTVNFVMPDMSMSPRIKQGFLIAVNTSWGDSFKTNSEYAIRIGSQYTLRRVISQFNGDVILRAENSEIANDARVSADEIKTLDVLGEFVCYLGR